MTKPATAEAFFTEDFAANAATLPGAGSPWLDERREAAIATLRAKGIPNRRVEDWKYSDLKVALEAANDLAPGTIAWKFASVPSGGELFDLADLSTAPEWVRTHFGESAHAGAMASASLALARSGFALRVPKNVNIAEPLRFVLSGVGHARVLILLEEGASLTLVETRKRAKGFSNIGVEIVLRSGAQLTHLRVTEPSAEAIEVEDVTGWVHRDAAYRAYLVNGGASLSRLTLNLALEGQGAQAEFSGATVLGRELHADVTTHIRHASGHTRSTQLFKHVVGGKGHAVYQGKITVAQGADGSDSRQTAKALLLCDRAEADLKPELEIFADDVKCAHGAAVGDLDPEQLFYLRTRGIPEGEARNLLLHAFLDDVLAGIARDDLRAEFRDAVESALPQAIEALP